MRKQVPVLVVDDEPDIAGLLVALLESEGHRTVHAASGQEAIELAIRLKPAALVLDLSLPDVDGLQVLHSLKTCAETRSIPVVVVSAFTGRLSQGDRSLVHAVFEKPFDLDALAETMNQLSARRHVPPIPPPARPGRSGRAAVTAT